MLFLLASLLLIAISKIYLHILFLKISLPLLHHRFIISHVHSHSIFIFSLIDFDSCLFLLILSIFIISNEILLDKVISLICKINVSLRIFIHLLQDLPFFFEVFLLLFLSFFIHIKNLAFYKFSIPNSLGS